MALVTAPSITHSHLPEPSLQPTTPTHKMPQKDINKCSDSDNAMLLQTMPPKKAKGIWGDNSPKKAAYTACEKALRHRQQEDWYQAVPLRPQKLAGTGRIGHIHLSLSSILCTYIHLYLDQKGFQDCQRAERALRIWMGQCQEDHHSHRQGWDAYLKVSDSSFPTYWTNCFLAQESQECQTIPQEAVPPLWGG